MVQLCERSPPTTVAWVRFPDPASQFVVGSRPCSEGFSTISPVFLPPQKPTLQIPIRSGNDCHRFVSCAVKCDPH